MFIPLSLIHWALLGGVAITSFMIGHHFTRNDTDRIIEETILSLIKQRMIKARMVDGEYEIYEYDEEI
tara:strand:- start:762 stop:965 length:204 start_codon:yes stop_codon:yes gene_type:complete